MSNNRLINTEEARALNREVAQNLGRADKAVSPTYFNT
jgi:hypothetical protein